MHAKRSLWTYYDVADLPPRVTEKEKGALLVVVTPPLHEGVNLAHIDRAGFVIVNVMNQGGSSLGRFTSHEVGINSRKRRGLRRCVNRIRYFLTNEIGAARIV